ncbi:hypothetical protein K438DRAFT_2061279 [Mycena galopus ATCC 62051]|nr:hypothetical protein K438DRAFT_2061279 [Mycena galopus ATCC 62051]
MPTPLSLLPPPPSRLAHGLQARDNVQVRKGNANWDLIDNLRTVLLHTSGGKSILTSMVPFVYELDGGSPRSPPLYEQIKTYLLNNFPDFPHGMECISDWMARSVEEKKTAWPTVQLSAALFRTGMDRADCPELHPEMLGAVLTATILHELVHALRCVFSTTLTPEKLRSTCPSSLALMIGPNGQEIKVRRGAGGRAWETSMLGEMRIALEGTGGNWIKSISKTEFKVRWVPLSERELLHLASFAVNSATRKTFTPPFPGSGDVWRHAQLPDGNPQTPACPTSPLHCIISDSLYRRIPIAEAKSTLERVTGLNVVVERPSKEKDSSNA